jgi:hypothetical protein
VAYYRLYFLDKSDRIREAIDMQCADDEAAIEAVAGHADGRRMELWNQDRVVRRFAAKDEAAA